mgnify:CR=1 FL=1
MAEEFGGEWRVKDAAGQTLTVMTPFHRLALAARNSAFQSKELKPKDVESVLKGSEGTLAFRVTLRGGSRPTSPASTRRRCSRAPRR